MKRGKKVTKSTKKMREKEATNQEKQFISEAVREGTRIDERGVDDLRAIQIQVGPMSGQAVVQYGSTRVFANVSCDIVRPSPSQPTEGTMSFNTEFSPMAFPSIYQEKTSELEINLSRVLEKALKKSRAIDTEGLCIVAGEKVWSIKIDIRVLDHCGNVLDCACLAAMTALLHFKRPDVSVDGHDVIIVYSFDVAFRR
jgi:exosome complex component RRP45